MRDCMPGGEDTHTEEIPLGARIIRAVRTFDSLTTASAAQRPLSPDEATREMRLDSSANYDPDILYAIERCVRRTSFLEPSAAVLV
jgi:HD-GYP domain-containing protein (c-di-GMP phosphodiesterase class II)